MLNRFLHPKSHELIHVVVLVLFTIGIVCSKAFMSLGIFLGLLNIVLEGSFKKLFLELKNARFFWLISFLFILHVIGLLWTSNYAEGLDDLRMKTSLLTVPLIVFSKPEIIRRFKQHLLNLLLATICCISLVNLMVYAQLFGQREYIDLRQLSLFGSHIRFGILVAFGMAISLYNLLQTRKKWYLLIIFYLVFYTIFSQVFSGLISLLLVFLVFAFYYFNSKKFRLFSWIIFAGVSISLCFILSFIFWPPDEKKELIVNSQELAKCWSGKSKMSISGKDKKGQPLEITLIRYMHSKNLTADSTGFQRLLESDIKEVENGSADIHEKNPFIGKLNELRFQIYNENNPNGSTIWQRLEYWKMGLIIIKENVFLGVGTGDIKDEFQRNFNVTNSSLLTENRLEAHNTYLTFFITFGIFGFFYLIYFLIKTFYNQSYQNDFLGLTFIVLISVSFLTEDTLETQMGITIFSFLYSVFSIKKPKEIL